MGKVRNSPSSESYMTARKVVNRNSPSLQKYLQQGAALLAQGKVKFMLNCMYVNIQYLSIPALETFAVRLLFCYRVWNIN